jgi:hypothetical protein
VGNLVAHAHIVLFVAEPYRLSLSTEDANTLGIEPALDSVCVHTRRDAVMFDNPEAEGITLGKGMMPTELNSN